MADESKTPASNPTAGTTQQPVGRQATEAKDEPKVKLLTNAHPELGDTVYDGDSEVGKVDHYFSQLGPTTWSAHIAEHGDEPVVIKMEDVLKDGKVIGQRLVLAEEA